MPEIKIARFVDIRACKSIFSEKSTFVLRSPEHYKRLYETTGGKEGDRNEGCAHIAGGRTPEFTGFVCSCWTMLKGSEPTHDEWNIFKEDEWNIVAIVSTPSKVSEFLNKTLETNEECGERRFPFEPVEHNEVDYKSPNHVDHTNIWDIVPFSKGEQFREESEYRFVLKYSEYSHVIDSYIFCGGIDYMEKCFVNPEISKEEKEKLHLVILIAMCGYGDFTNKEMSDIIANADILF